MVTPCGRAGGHSSGSHQADGGDHQRRGGQHLTQGRTPSMGASHARRDREGPISSAALPRGLGGGITAHRIGR
eukprot:9729578-Lingulodinium_polyedra.AAC.1